MATTGRRRAAWFAGIIAALLVAAYAAFQLSPWPSALVYRTAMDWGGESLNAALERHVPNGVSAVTDLRYHPEATLDVFYPHEGRGPLPTIVWIHGGAFLSGDKAQVANYLKILAGRGYTTVGLNYSLGPGARYPTPVRQANVALGYLVRDSQRLRIDPQRLYLAGDSAGAHIAAQLANSISVPSYAKALGFLPSIDRKQLRGVILHCGVYDLALARFDGAFGHFMRTAIWSYGGRPRPAHMREFSVTRYVSADFPPAFITAGNGDPLLAHSHALAEALAKVGVKVDTLFFPADYKPELPHEYQFNLDTDAGRLALERTLEFLRR
jgi:acetyl esterase/lipase